MTIGFGMGSPMQGKQDGLRVYTAKGVGAGAATLTSLEGDASSVSYDASGIYTFTFPGDVTWDIRDVQVSIKQAATKELFGLATYSESARTVTVVIKDATNATPFTDTDLTSSETLHLVVLVKTTKAPA